MIEISKKLVEKLAPVVKFILSDTDQYETTLEILEDSNLRKELTILGWNNEMIDFLEELEKEYPDGVTCPECGSLMSVKCPMAFCAYCGEEIFINLPNESSDAVCNNCISSKMHTCPMHNKQ